MEKGVKEGRPLMSYHNRSVPCGFIPPRKRWVYFFVQSLASKDDGEREECCGAVLGILLWFNRKVGHFGGGQSWPATAAILGIQKPAQWTARVLPLAPTPSATPGTGPSRVSWSLPAC
jgi:hypothetical protein